MTIDKEHFPKEIKSLSLSKFVLEFYIILHYITYNVGIKIEIHVNKIQAVKNLI